MSEVVNLADRRGKKVALSGDVQKIPSNKSLAVLTPLPPYPPFVPPEITPGEVSDSTSQKDRKSSPVSVSSVIKLGLPVIEGEIFELEKALVIVKKGSDNSSKAIAKIQNAIRNLKTFCSALRSAQ